MARARTKPADDDAEDFLGADFDVAANEIVEAKVDLRKKVRQTARRSGGKDPIAAAEAAVQELSASFDNWMRAELDTLTERWRAAARDGYSAPSRDALFRAAHDIKGQAATLGYPLVGEAAGSLCNLLLTGPSAPQLPLALVDHHVQAIRAMIREEAREGNKTARQLADKLVAVTEEFLASVARAA